MKNFLTVKKVLLRSFFFSKVSVNLLSCLSKSFKSIFLVVAAFEVFLNFFCFYKLHNFFYFKFLVHKPYIYIILNLTRLQTFYSFTYSNFLLFKAFSTGVLLKFFFILTKKTRRAVVKQRPIFNFLKKFFFLRLLYGCEFWFYGFKKKFLPILLEFSNWRVSHKFIWILKKSFGLYKYRRVVAIKKRIRKSIKAKGY